MGTGWQRWLLGALLAVVSLALALRVTGGDRVVTPDEILFRDNDTARRLVRLQDLTDPDKPYPYRNPQDGYPEGTVIHWTLPMDLVLVALDPLVSWAYPQARRFEAAAIWVNVVLGAVALLAFALLSFRWLGPPRGLLATALYALSHPAISITSYGNGDHQGLQHLCALLSLLGFARLVQGQGRTRTALMIGTALGLGLWVSAETTVVFQLMALGALLHVRILPARDRPDAATLHLIWTAGCAVIAFLGDRFEHPGQLFTFEWDRVSGFQLYQVLVVALFLGLVRVSWRTGFARFRDPLVAAATAIGIGLVVLLLTRLGAATREQLDLFAGANRWTQASINEYRPLFFRYGVFYPLLAVQQLGWLVFLVPLFAIGCALNRRDPASARVPLVAVALGLFALTCLEIKLGHLFAILYPWLIITGGSWYLDRFGMPRLWQPVLGCGALVSVLLTIPPRQGEVGAGQVELREVMTELRALAAANDPDDEMRAVLATWEVGAMLMYYGRVPAVATGYHRNLAGITDSIRVLLSTDWETRLPILRKRRVRWILSSARLAFLTEVEDILPALPFFVDITGSEWTGDGRVELHYRTRPVATQTLQWYLTFWRPGIERDPGLQLVWESRQTGEGLDPRFPTPHYRIWRVVYPEER